MKNLLIKPFKNIQLKLANKTLSNVQINNCNMHCNKLNIYNINLSMICICIMFLLCSCANHTKNETSTEQLNKDIFYINNKFDEYVLRPFAITYKEIVPKTVQLGVKNAISNLKTPFYAVTSLISQEKNGFSKNIMRFLINSTFGIFGLVDVADKLGYKKNNIEFEDALTKQKFNTGTYLVLPLYGSCSVRDLITLPVSFAIDLTTYFIPLYGNIIKITLDAFDKRAENDGIIEMLKENPDVDLYIVTKNIYMNKHNTENKKPEINDNDEW